MTRAVRVPRGRAPRGCARLSTVLLVIVVLAGAVPRTLAMRGAFASAFRPAERTLQEKGLLPHPDDDASAPASAGPIPTTDDVRGRRRRRGGRGCRRPRDGRRSLPPARRAPLPRRDAPPRRSPGLGSRAEARRDLPPRGARADPNHRAALTALGRAHQAGEGVDVDDALALDLFRRAASLGDPGAHEELGFAHSTGWAGVPEDTARAVLHQYFAAMGGDPRGQMAMGYRHLHGLGTPKSCATAALYYEPPASKLIDVVPRSDGGADAQRREDAVDAGHRGRRRRASEGARRGAVLPVQRGHGKRGRGDGDRTHLRRARAKSLRFGTGGARTGTSPRRRRRETRTPCRSWGTCSPTGWGCGRTTRRRSGCSRRPRRRATPTLSLASGTCTSPVRRGTKREEGAELLHQGGGAGQRRGAVSRRRDARQGRRRAPRLHQGVLQLQPRRASGSRRRVVQPGDDATRRRGCTGVVQERRGAPEGPSGARALEPTSRVRARRVQGPRVPKGARQVHESGGDWRGGPQRPRPRRVWKGRRRRGTTGG